MDVRDAIEQAYKNGYEAGKRDAVVHGRWIPPEHPKILPTCSICGCPGLIFTYNYCPICGAKIDLEG